MHKLYIVLLTYAAAVDSPRAQYAERTLRATLDRLHYSGQISVHIADDGSPDEHRRRLIEIAGGYADVHGVTVSNAERRGYGASYNLAMQTTHIDSSLILPLEDDWELIRPFDLDPYASILIGCEMGRTATDRDWLGCIRFGYLGYTQELRGKLVSHQGQMFLRFDEDSAEPHVFAGHPRLETVGWQRKVGVWPEGLDAGSTEFFVAQRAVARRGVGWPMAIPPGSLWAHIGSVQAREDQREA